MREINKILKIFRIKDEVLFLAGDQDSLMYAADNVSKVYDLEIDLRKLKIPKKPRNLKIKKGNIFDIIPSTITNGEKVNVVINMLPLDIIRSVRAMCRLRTIFKKNARILIKIKEKGQPLEEMQRFVVKLLEDEGISPMKFLRSGEDLYVYARNAEPPKILEAVVLS